jgi:hypothetical protein
VIVRPTGSASAAKRTVKAQVVAALAVLALVSGGCGSTTSPDPAAVAAMPGGDRASMSAMAGMSGMDMSSAAPVGSGPTQTASMICGHEIRTAVQHTLELSRPPERVHSWAHRLYTCTYQLPGGGQLRLSVKDLDTPRPGRAYFDRLRTATPGAKNIVGLPAFGFPAFESPHGDVVFLKDHKTLHVDATRLTPKDLPPGITRQVAAYGVAAAVIACWTE